MVFSTLRFWGNRQGASVDEMEAECVRTKRALEKTNAAIKGLEEMAHVRSMWLLS